MCNLMRLNIIEKGTRVVLKKMAGEYTAVRIKNAIITVDGDETNLEYRVAYLSTGCADVVDADKIFLTPEDAAEELILDLEEKLRK